MKINIKYTDTDPDDELRAYAEEKVSAFSKLIDERLFDAAICDIEFRKSTRHQKGSDVCYAEVTLETDGVIYRASKEEPTLQKAIDKVKDDILSQMRRDKRKAQSRFVRGGQIIKRLLRRGGESGDL